MKRQKIHVLIPVSEIENISNDLKSNERLVRSTNNMTKKRNIETKCLRRDADI